MSETRRKFLQTGVVVSSLLSEIRPLTAAVFDPAARTTLTLVMDIMIPAGDGMPSASEAGGLAYLDRVSQHDQDAAAAISEGLAVLDAFSAKRFEKPFRDLASADRIAALRAMEQAAPAQFAALRDFVYESYYTQPHIWKLIGYELYPTDHAGPHMQPVDESLLDGVRKMPKLYREA